MVKLNHDVVHFFAPASDYQAACGLTRKRKLSVRVSTILGNTTCLNCRKTAVWMDEQQRLIAKLRPDAKSAE